MAKEKLFRLTIELEEVIDDESIAPLFICGQVCSGIDQIKTTLGIFNVRLEEFIENTLIPNQKKK